MAISSKEWLSVLLNENGASYYVDDQGVVRPSSTPVPLKNMFDGWQAIVLNYGRSAKYQGLERTYTSSYKFVKDGAAILRYLLYSDRTIESKVYLGLLKWDSDTNQYNLYYKAEVDLSQAVDDPSTGVTVEVMQDGPAKYIKINESIEYEVDCDQIDVRLDGVIYSDVYNYFSSGLPSSSNKPRAAWIVPANFLNNEGQSVGIKRGDQSFEEIPEDVDATLELSSNYILSSDTPLNVRVQGQFSVSRSGEDSYRYDLFLYVCPIYPPLAVKKYMILAGPTSITPPGIDTINYDQVLSLSGESKLFLVFSLGDNMGGIDLLETNFKLSFDTRFKPTITKAVRPLELFKKLVSEMTNGKFKAESTLLQQNEHLVCASGDAIRGVTNPKIKTNFSNFFTSYSKILKGALGVDYNTQTVIFEERSYFFDQTTELIDLGEVEGFTVEVAKENVFSSVKTGYTSQKDEEAAAREEVNASQQYVTSISRIKRELDLVVPYRTDIFGIERLRQQFEDKTIQDSRADNAVFIININRQAEVEGWYNVYREIYSSITGGTNLESWYNIEQLTPKRILETNGDLLSGGLFSIPNESVTFKSADKNARLITVYPSGKVVSESSNIRNSALKPSFFRPYLFKFTTKVPQNVVSLLQESRGGYITGTWKGTRFYGFALDLSVKPVLNEAQEWTLLMSSQMNTADLVNINDEEITLESMGIISHKLPVKFVRVGATYPLQYHFKQMDSDWFHNRIGRYSQKSPYFQKWQTNEAFSIQFITKEISASVVIVDCKGVTVDTVSLTNIPSASIPTGHRLYQGVVDCSVLSPGQVYYLVSTFGIGTGADVFVSEPMLLGEDWPETLVFDYSNSKNQKDLIWEAPYTGKIRVEGFIQEFQPGGVTSQYEDEPMDLVNIDGEPTRSYMLLIGSDFGVPDWMIDKMNRILMLDSITIDGVDYTPDKDAKLEPVYTPGVPTAYWSIRIREAKNRAGIAIDGSGTISSPITVEYDINTKGFSSTQSPADQTDTIIQVTGIE